MKYSEVREEAASEIADDLRKKATRRVKEKLVEVELARSALATMEAQLEELMDKEVEVSTRAMGCAGTVLVGGVEIGRVENWGFTEE